MRLASALLLLGCLAFGQNTVGPPDLGTRWTGADFKEAQCAMSGYAIRARPGDGGPRVAERT